MGRGLRARFELVLVRSQGNMAKIGLTGVGCAVLRYAADGPGGRHDEEHLTNCADDSDVCGCCGLSASLHHGASFGRDPFHDSWRWMHGGVRISAVLFD